MLAIITILMKFSVVHGSTRHVCKIFDDDIKDTVGTVTSDTLWSIWAIIKLIVLFIISNVISYYSGQWRATRKLQRRTLEAFRQQDAGGDTMHQQTHDPPAHRGTIELPKTIVTRDVIAQSPVTYKKYTSSGSYAPRFTPLPDNQWGAAWPDSIDMEESLLISSYRSSNKYRRNFL